MPCNGGVTVILGAQWGDEGKGKIVDMISAEADICCRCMVNIFKSGLLYTDSCMLRARIMF